MSPSRKVSRTVSRRLTALPALPAAVRDTVPWVLLALPVCIPALVFGGNVSEVESGSGVLLCLLAAGLFLSAGFDPIARDRRTPLLLAATSLLAVWPLFQLIPGTALGVSATQWQHAAEFTRERVPYTATLAIDETWRAVPVAFATWGAFWVGALGFAKRRRQTLLWITVLAFVVANCAYGLGIYAAGRNEVLGYKHAAWVLDATGGVVTGTFINRNHFAFLCCAGLALALTLMTRTQQVKTFTTRQKLKAWFDQWPVLVLMPVAMVLFISIFLSQSRGGILMAISVIGIALALRIKHRAWMIAAAVLVVLLVPVIYELTFVTAYSRARVTESFVSSANDRLDIQKETARAIVASGGLGVGGGAFEQAFPLFRQVAPGAPGIWNAAHGSYVEWPFTYGVPWFAVLLATAGGIMTTILRAQSRTGTSNAALPVLVLTACLLHVTYDFGLQTLGLTIIVAALAGSSWGRAVVSASRPSRRHATPSTDRPVAA